VKDVARSRRRRALRELLRSAAVLNPVVVDQGPGQVKLASHVEGVERHGDDWWVVLFPIDAAALADRPVVVRSRAPERPWGLRAQQLARRSDRRVDLLLAGDAALFPLAARSARTIEPGRAGLALVLPVGAGRHDVNIFPIAELGSRHCTIVTVEPLPVGKRYDPVEIRGGELWSLAATVLEAIPWSTPDGRRLVRCRLALDPTLSGTSAEPFDDPERVRRVLRLAASLQVGGWVSSRQADGGRIPVRLLALNEAELIVALEEAGEPPDLLSGGFELFSVSYQWETTVCTRNGRVLTLAAPRVLGRRRFRRHPRAVAPPDEAIVVSFRDPSAGRQIGCPVRDVAQAGLCFTLDRRAQPPAAGAALLDVVVRWRMQRVRPGRMEVRTIEGSPGGPTLVHAELRHPGAAGLTRLAADLRHPTVEVHDGRGFSEMLEHYRGAGLLSAFMLRNLEPVAPAAARSWERIHRAPADLGCTFVRRRDGAIEATCSGVRAWERTWLGQHLAAAPAASSLAVGAVQARYLDAVLAHPATHHFAFFIRSDNIPMTAFIERFRRLAGTAEVVGRATVELWHAAPGRSAAVSARSRRLRPEEEPLLARAAERVLGSLPAHALSLVDGDCRLPGIERAFLTAGLERSREVSVVCESGRPLLAVLEERASPGINLTGMLSASWILPLRTEETATRGMVQAVARILGAGPATPTGDRLVITIAGADPAALLAAGFERMLVAHLYAFDRSGMTRYRDYVAERYGALEARTAGRRAQARAGATPV
jgi:hypothetical protein